MRPEEAMKMRAALEPRWDEVREQRVLGRVVAAKRSSEEPSPRARVIMPLALVLAVAAILLLVVRMRQTPEATSIAAAPSVLPSASAAPDPQFISLADGSKAVLLRQAILQVDEQSAKRIHITQSAGSVRYEVVPNPGREFIVEAGETTVRVRGTIFTVDVSSGPDTTVGIPPPTGGVGGSVDVHVDRGRVEVQHGPQIHTLVAGETLHVAAGIGEDPDQPPTPSMEQPQAPAVPTADALLERADNARRAGNNADAASALEMLLATYPRDPRAGGAVFTLGRVYRAMGRRADAAAMFERCASGGGPLSQDGLAEAAISWASAGRRDIAKRDAEAYLKRYPQGGFAEKMRDLAE